MFCVFETYGDGDGYTSFNLIGVYDDLNKCINEVSILPTFSITTNGSKPVHKDMNKENNYVAICSRKDCNIYCAGFGGYVIEKVELNEII